MKRLLYIAFSDFSNMSFGPNAKMLSQCRAFEEYGYTVDLACRRREDNVLIRNGSVAEKLSVKNPTISNIRFRNLASKFTQIQAIKKYLKAQRYDACYIRYDFSDPAFLSLLKQLRKVCPKIALELPTYPYEAENKYGILSKMRMAVDKLYRKQLHKYIDFIVTFYVGHSQIFGIPVEVIPNGFDFSTMDLTQSELPEDGIHIIAVSSMREWHGYERLIEGLHNYYNGEDENPRNVVLHLVGDGREYGKYKSLVDTYGLQEHVIMEGAMHGQQLDELYEICALGIDSLARHRSGIDILSSLKSREYGAKGLPIINSCKIDIIDDDFPYLLRVPADETPIEVSKLVEFYDRCFGGEKSRGEVGIEVRSYIEARSGMKETLRPVAAKLGQELKQL